MYAGLTKADKTALLNAKQAGQKEYGVWLEEKNGWKRMVTVNIDLALAQIAEMESAEKQMTNRDAYLKMLSDDVELLAALKVGYDSYTDGFYTTDINGKILKRYKHVREAHEAQVRYFASTYTEGETK